MKRNFHLEKSLSGPISFVLSSIVHSEREIGALFFSKFVRSVKTSDFCCKDVIDPKFCRVQKSFKKVLDDFSAYLTGHINFLVSTKLVLTGIRSFKIKLSKMNGNFITYCHDAETKTTLTSLKIKHSVIM